MKRVSNKIFVFGSNLAGRHGKGAALFAKNKHGAIRGIGEGIQGNSYGIPTKDELLNSLPLEIVKKHVDTFIQYAKDNPDKVFQVTLVGCGLAGFTPSQIGPLFEDSPDNVELPREFLDTFKWPGETS